MGLFNRKPEIWKPGREVIVPRPEPSGVHGTQGLSQSDAELAETALLGHSWGAGIPVLESAESGAVLRYCGENSLVCFGPPGAGKVTDIQARCVLECAATRSQLIIDASGGQIAAGTLTELRKHARVVVFSPTSEGLPPGVAELLGPSRSYNPWKPCSTRPRQPMGCNATAPPKWLCRTAMTLRRAGSLLAGRAR